MVYNNWFKLFGAYLKEAYDKVLCQGSGSRDNVH